MDDYRPIFTMDSSSVTVQTEIRLNLFQSRVGGYNKPRAWLNCCL